jgi:hypothetical protein
MRKVSRRGIGGESEGNRLGEDGCYEALYSKYVFRI